VASKPGSGGRVEQQFEVLPRGEPVRVLPSPMVRVTTTEFLSDHERWRIASPVADLQAALAKLADPTGELRPTAARVLKALRAGGPQTIDQLTASLVEHGRAIRSATVQVALGELMAAELVADADGDGQQRWLALPMARDPLLEAVELEAATTTSTRAMAARPGRDLTCGLRMPDPSK
jgi:hypothetical protein